MLQTCLAWVGVGVDARVHAARPHLRWCLGDTLLPPVWWWPWWPWWWVWWPWWLWWGTLGLLRSLWGRGRCSRGTVFSFWRPSLRRRSMGMMNAMATSGGSLSVTLLPYVTLMSPITEALLTCTCLMPNTWKRITIGYTQRGPASLKTREKHLHKANHNIHLGDYHQETGTFKPQVFPMWMCPDTINGGHQCFTCIHSPQKRCSISINYWSYVFYAANYYLPL